VVLSDPMEHDSTLVRRVSQLDDSLRLLDLAMRESQFADADSTTELAKRQADLWANYTWARARLSQAQDSKIAAAAPHSLWRCRRAWRHIG
jgi:hypothetical protein